MNSYSVLLQRPCHWEAHGKHAYRPKAKGAHALQALVHVGRRADEPGPAANESDDQLRKRCTPQYRRRGPVVWQSTRVPTPFFISFNAPASCIHSARAPTRRSPCHRGPAQPDTTGLMCHIRMLFILLTMAAGPPLAARPDCTPHDPTRRQLPPPKFQPVPA